MISLVIGGQKCGKSAFAEQLALDSVYERRYYIATMQVQDAESLERKNRHRMMRSGKGFKTLEIPHHIEEAAFLMEEPDKCCVLLECAANLVANIMHEDEWKERSCKEGDEGYFEFVSYVTDLVRRLSGLVGDIIVVSSEYSKERGMDKETLKYIDLLNGVNGELISLSDRVYDMRYGNP